MFPPAALIAETGTERHPCEHMQKISVLVGDDHAVVREGLRSLLDASGNIAVIGEAENGLREVSEAIRLQPDAIESNRLPLLWSARSS
jgi:PleD family two-component response regulator